MSKIKSIYSHNLDKAWYDSSTILYSECDDIYDNLKVLRVFFKSGTVYQYKNVNVNDYLLFREAVSQGKALTQYIKKYEYEKLGEYDIDSKIKELNENLQTNSPIDKFRLFDKLEDVCNQVNDIANEFRELNLNTSELAYLSYILNTSISNMSLINFSQAENIDLLAVSDLLENTINKLKSDSEYNNLQKKLKDTLLYE